VFCTKCGLELPGDSQFCRKCGYAFPIPSSQSPVTAPTTAQQPPGGSPIAPTQSIPGHSTFKVGTLVFAVFSVLSLVVCFAKGLVPIYLGEAALWAALAWYWHKKGSTSEIATLIILLLAVGVAAGEGYLIGRDSNVAGEPTTGRLAAGIPPLPPGFTLDQPSTPARDNSDPSAQAFAASPCPSGIPAGANISEIPPSQLAGSNGSVWFVDNEDDNHRGRYWYFHFSVLNNNNDYCLTAVEYEVEIESDEGVLWKGRGKKHIGPLSPGGVYTPRQKDDDDEVKFSAKPKNGKLSTWKLTKGYGFSLPASVSR
jgi:zinc-ribbon domain